MNWVLIIAGLIPLWAALLIVFMNMRVLKDDTVQQIEAPRAKPTPVQELVVEEPQPLELELTMEQPVEPEKSKGKLGGLFDRFKKDKKEAPVEEEIDFTEPVAEEQGVSIGFPRGLRRIWGVTLVLVFVACLAYGSEHALAYLFKEYRWVIGTTNPWTSQLALASVSTIAIAGVSFMVAALKTGIYLIRH